MNHKNILLSMNQNIHSSIIIIFFCHSVLTGFVIAMHAEEAVALGFQHYILTLGMTVLIPAVVVPEMGGSNVSTFVHFLFSFSNFTVIRTNKLKILNST